MKYRISICKRNPRVFLVEIQRRFPERERYGRKWHRQGGVRGLVAVYYVVLRAVLRNKPRLRRYIARCRHCWIFFVADPRNVRREDLGCPFGCADLHRRRRSKERSVRYNGSPVGKAKRHRRNEEQRRAVSAPSTPGGLEGSPAACGDGRPTVPLEGTHNAVESSAGPLPRDLEVDQRSAAPEAMSPAAEPAASRAPVAACGPASYSNEDHDGPESRDERAARGDPLRLGGSPMAPAVGSGAVGPVAAERERAEDAPAMVDYIRVVVSLIEERDVERREILEMLARTKRQHSFAREKRVDYVLRRLREEPEKPP